MKTTGSSLWKSKQNKRKSTEIFMLLKFKINYPRSLYFSELGEQKCSLDNVLPSLLSSRLFWFSISSSDKIANVEFPRKPFIPSRFSNPLAFISIFVLIYKYSNLSQFPFVSLLSNLRCLTHDGACLRCFFTKEDFDWETQKDSLNLSAHVFHWPNLVKESEGHRS